MAGRERPTALGSTASCFGGPALRLPHPTPKARRVGQARREASAGPPGILIGLSVLLALSPPLGAAEQDGPEKTAAEMITPAAERAIERGLAALAEKQHEDGSFGSGSYRGNVAICGLAGMAFMSGGSTPGRGPYGSQVARCLDYLLANSQESGFVVAPGAASHGPMYGHGFAALFLAECHGMSPRGELREKLAKAVELIVNTQNVQGGWRYQPQRADADISVTICQVMALRAARNAGLHVPSETIDRCVDYVKRSQNPDGGFKYMVNVPGDSRFALTAAGLVALYSAGVYEGPEIDKGLEFMMRSLPGGNAPRQQGHYHYGHYYAVQAAWQAGGDYWQRWYPAIRDELLAQKTKEGSWPSSTGREYATAMACIVLQIPENHLPIFQR